MATAAAKKQAGWLEPDHVSVFRRYVGHGSDPLGDVINWLGHADLGGDVLDGELAAAQPCGSSGARELFVEPGRERQSRNTDDSVDAFGSLPMEPLPARVRSQNAVASLPQLRSGTRSTTVVCGIGKDSDPRGVPGLEPEELEWDMRQRQTGAAGRLVVYEEDDQPMEDILLRGGGLRRVMVASVTEGGKAAQAGIKAGDVLVSIDGKKDFKGTSADLIHASLHAPVMLVFMGFVGKLQAEVRLNYRQKVCGFASQQQVAIGRPEAPLQVVDEVVFQPGSASLFLATTQTLPRRSANRRPLWRSGSGAILGGVGDTLPEDDADVRSVAGEDTAGTGGGADGEPESLPAVYELRGHEARNLVSRALSRVRSASSPNARPPVSSPSRSLGDHAQVPRAVRASPSPLRGRLADQLSISHEFLTAKTFDNFPPRGGQAVKLARSEKMICDIAWAPCE